MLLEGKVAVVYGAYGKIGSKVAATFAREGAKVHLTGRNQAKLDAVATTIREAGGNATTGIVDAMDKAAVEQHMDGIIAADGRIDASFNAVWIRGDLQGTPLIEMTPENLVTPVTVAVTTHFITTTAAARHMVKAGSGVLLTLSSTSSVLSGREQAYHSTGGFGIACGAIESLTRTLAGQLGRSGIRAICLRSDAFPETWGTLFEGQADSPLTFMTAGTVLGRMPKIQELAEAAAFAASDRSSAMTGTVINLSCGSVLA